MCVDMEYLEYISPVVLPDSNTPFVCLPIDNVKISGRLQRRLFYVNESHIYLFEQKAITKSFAQVFCENYTNLQKIYLPDDSHLILNFNQHITVEINHELVKQMTQMLVLYLNNALTNREIPEVELYEFDYTLLSHSYLAFYNRFRFLCFKNGKIPSREIASKIHNYCLTNPTELDTLMIDTTGEYTPFLLESLQIEPNITTLIVQTPKMGALWKEVSNMFTTNTTITTFFSYEYMTKSFDLLAKAFQENKRLKLKKIFFFRSKITPGILKTLGKIVSSHQFEEFGLLHALTGDSTTTFLNTFRTEPLFKSLTSLSLDGTKNLDLSLLLRSTCHLSSISLANCNFELCLFFGFLVLNKDSKLKNINLTGNKATRPIKDCLKLPETLQSIQATNITFKDDNLLRLMKLLTQKTMKIDVSHSMMDETQWNNFFENIDTLPNDKLISLIWNENPIYLEFIDFLESQKSLEVLHVNGCFSSGDSLILTEFTKFISSNTVLKELSASGLTKTFGDDELLSFLKGFGGNRTITSLDISNQNITYKSLNLIKQLLISNRKIQNIKMNTQKLYKPDCFLKFLELLAQRGVPLTIDWPQADLIAFQELGVLSEVLLKQIKDTYETVQKGNSSIEVPKSCIQREHPPKKFRRRVVRKNRNFNQTDGLVIPALELDSFVSHLDSKNTVIGVLLPECQVKPPPVDITDYDVSQPTVPFQKDPQLINKYKKKYNPKTLFENLQNTL